jgi:CDP-glycerol glycerophosphotransferase (TagB/SpsB family)
MPEAAVLISSPSTVVYEAMAAGKPVVLFPVAGEPLLEFAEPKGAFEIARDPADLPDLLRAALAGKDGCRDRCRGFLDFHVSIDPKVASTERTVQALINIRAR